MQLGREAYRGKAVMALGVDENIPDDLLNSIRKIDGMENAVFIKL